MDTITEGRLDGAALDAWRSYLQSHASIVRMLDAELVAEHGMTTRDYEVLLYLAQAPERKLPMSALAERTMLTRSGITRLIDGLVEARPDRARRVRERRARLLRPADRRRLREAPRRRLRPRAEHPPPVPRALHARGGRAARRAAQPPARSSPGGACTVELARRARVRDGCRASGRALADGSPLRRRSRPTSELLETQYLTAQAICARWLHSSIISARSLPMSATTISPDRIPAGIYSVDPTHSNVVVRGPPHGHRHRARQLPDASRARSTPAATPRCSTGTVEVDSIDTGDENRDGHLKAPDFFDVAQYPQITFHSTGGEPTDDGQIRLDRRDHDQGHHQADRADRRRSPRTARIRGATSASASSSRARSTAASSTSSGTRRSRTATCSSPTRSSCWSASRPSRAARHEDPRRSRAACGQRRTTRRCSRAAAELAPGRRRGRALRGLEPLPPYNEDRDTDLPPAEVARLRDAIERGGRACCSRRRSTTARCPASSSTRSTGPRGPTARTRPCGASRWPRSAPASPTTARCGPRTTSAGRSGIAGRARPRHRARGRQRRTSVFDADGRLTDPETRERLAELLAGLARAPPRRTRMAA